MVLAGVAEGLNSRRAYDRGGLTREERGREVQVTAYKSRETGRWMQIRSVSDNLIQAAVEEELDLKRRDDREG